MSHLDTGVQGEATPVELLQERDALTRALLTASARLAEAEDPDAILRCACDIFINASPRIRLACMYMGAPDSAASRPSYAVGPALACAKDIVWWGGGPRMQRSVDSQTLRLRRPFVADIRTDASFGPSRERALEHNLQTCMYLPFSTPGSRAEGAVVLYADQADYFHRLGVESFLAFAQLGQVAFGKVMQRKQLQDLATIDSLTGLLNRNALQKILEREHARSQRHGRPYSVMLLDVDCFKSVNDNYGHATGDKALIAVARVARRSLREGDWVGRWGGDEFLCLLPDADDEKGTTIAERLRAQVADQPIDTGGVVVPVSVSVGLSHYPQAGDRLDNILTSADAALYGAKRRGRNRVVSSSREARGLFSIGSQLESALRSGRVQPAYQPIVDLRSGKVVGEEALARILTEDGSLLEAAGFIPAANQLQMVRHIDTHVIRQAINHLREQASSGKLIAHFVNISAELLRHPELVDEVLEQIQEFPSGGNGQSEGGKPLVFEITEWEFLNNAREVRRILRPFLDQGMRLAIDDFGSGYSSFQYLADLPVDYLKIDGELVRRATREPRVRSILRGIRDIADDLALTTAAEWVEDEATVDLLRDVGIHWAQGYYFGRPQLGAGASAAVNQV
ncbi:MAG: putative bifunctional diguanylate cyclase/phosphodiesterase [Acidiferrobacterales bacterium]